MTEVVSAPVTEVAVVRPPRPVFAALLTLPALGLGQFYSGRSKRALVWWLAFLTLESSALAFAAYVPWRWSAVVGGVVLGGAFGACMVDAAAIAAKQRSKGIPQPRWWATLAALVLICAASWVAARCIILLWLEPFTVPTEGMADTIMAGDRIFADKLWYRWHALARGDVIVYRDVRTGQPFVKRLVGLSGDVVELRNEQVYVNGQRLSEPYVKLQGPLPQMAGAADRAPQGIPDGRLFLLGDNRHRSSDSRFGELPEVKDVLGRAMFVYFSREPAAHRRLGEPAAPPQQRTIRWGRIGGRL